MDEDGIDSGCKMQLPSTTSDHKSTRDKEGHRSQAGKTRVDNDHRESFEKEREHECGRDILWSKFAGCYDTVHCCWLYMYSLMTSMKNCGALKQVMNPSQS